MKNRNDDSLAASSQPKIRRRDLIKAAAAAAVSLPYFVPASALGKAGRPAPSNRVVMGGIGYGISSYGTPYGWFENPGGFWSDASGVLRNDAPIPAIGEHTVSILTELGLSATTIEDLLAAGVVGCGPA